MRMQPAMNEGTSSERHRRSFARSSHACFSTYNCEDLRLCELAGGQLMIHEKASWRGITLVTVQEGLALLLPAWGTCYSHPPGVSGL